MINIQFTTVYAAETIERMAEQLRAFGHEDVPDELTHWQSEDMHRHFPNTETPNYVSAETRIWPRSRTYEQTHKGRQSRYRPIPRVHGPRTPGGKRVIVVHRTILRPELFDKLTTRMKERMERVLKWQSTSQR